MKSELFIKKIQKKFFCGLPGEYNFAHPGYRKQAYFFSWPNRTKQNRWSQVIKRKRLSWLGHLLRLPDETPAKKAVNEYTKQIKRKVGRPRLTWFKQIYNDLKDKIDSINLKDEFSMIKDLDIICRDRKRWKSIIRSIMLDEPTNMQ